MYQNLINLEEGADKESVIQRKHRIAIKGMYRTFHQYLDKKANYRVQSDLYHNIFQNQSGENIDKSERIEAIKEYLSKPPNLAFPDFICTTELKTIDDYLENIDKMREIYQKTDQIIVANEHDSRIYEISKKLNTLKDEGYEKLLPKFVNQIDSKHHSPAEGKTYDFEDTTYTKPANIQHINIDDYKRNRYKILNSAKIGLLHKKNRANLPQADAETAKKKLPAIISESKEKVATISEPQKASINKNNRHPPRPKRRMLVENEGADIKRKVSFQMQPEKNSGVTIAEGQPRQHLSFTQGMNEDQSDRSASPDFLTILNKTIDQSISATPIPKFNNTEFMSPEAAYFLPQKSANYGRSLTPIERNQQVKPSGNNPKSLVSTFVRDASNLTLNSSHSKNARATIYAHHKQNREISRAKAPRMNSSQSSPKPESNPRVETETRFLKEKQPTTQGSFMSLHDTTGLSTISKEQNILSSAGLSRNGRKLRKGSVFLNKTFESATQDIILPGFSNSLKKRFGIQPALEKLALRLKISPEKKKLREIVHLGVDLKEEVLEEKAEVKNQMLQIEFKHDFQHSTHKILQDLNFSEGKILETLYLYKKNNLIEDKNDQEKAVSEHMNRNGNKQLLVNKTVRKKLKEDTLNLALRNKLLKNEDFSISGIIARNKRNRSDP